MTVEFSFFDPTLDQQGQPDRVYNAQQFTDYFKSLVTTGIMRQHEDEMLVSADGTTMQTSIGKGTCFIEGRQMIVTAPHLMLHDTESVGLNRIDRIVVRLDLRVEARHVMPFIKKGVASANPVAPTLQRDNEVYEISLASVTVTGGRSYLQASDILDERANEELCGWATSDIFPNYSDDTLQAVLTQTQNNDTRIGNHEKNVVNHTAYGVATGTNAKTITTDMPITSLVDGMSIAFKNNTANTDAVTLNVNGTGAKTVVDINGNALLSGALKVNAFYNVRYNATNGNFFLLNDGGDVISGPATLGENIVYTADIISVYNETTLTELFRAKVNKEGSYRIGFGLYDSGYYGEREYIYIAKNGVKITDDLSFEVGNNSGQNPTNAIKFNFDLPDLTFGDTISVFGMNNGPGFYISNLSFKVGNNIDLNLVRREV